jgi:hypothetical protein
MGIEICRHIPKKEREKIVLSISFSMFLSYYCDLVDNFDGDYLTYDVSS